MTAIALLPAFATNSVSPLLLTAIAFGMLPSGSDSFSLTSISVSTVSLVVSITDMASLFELATYSRLPSGLSAIADGCRPTSIVFTTVAVDVSTTETVPLLAMPVSGSTTTGFEPSVASSAAGRRPAQLLTYTLSPSLVIAVVYGNAPVGTRVTTRVAVSMIPSAWARFRATYTLSPAGLTLKPLGSEDEPVGMRGLSAH